MFDNVEMQFVWDADEAVNRVVEDFLFVWRGGHGLFSVKVSVGASSDQRNELNGFVFFVYQKPVRIDMTFAFAYKITF